MVCLRCGYCCKYPMAIIVDNPELGIAEDNLIFHEGNGTPCKHLTGDKPGEYGCAVHDRDWYPETPCYDYDQIGEDADVCRMGKHLLTRKEAEHEITYRPFQLDTS